MHKVAKLAHALRENGVDAYFANSPVSMGYLHGFREYSHERFLVLAISATGAVRLICPSLSESQARRSGITDIRSWRDGEHPESLLSELARDWKLDSAIIAVDDEMPALTLLQAQATLPAALFKPGGKVLSQLMEVKSEEEIEIMRRAADIADKAYYDVLPKLKPGLTETQVAKMLEDAMAARGGGPYFSIVATGPNSAEPHHLSDDTRLEEGQILLLDFGCDLQGYKSDITRTLCLGRASDEMREVYGVVRQAHNAALQAGRAGMTGADLDSVARQVISDAGYGEFFIHRTGHGIGMRGHEEPYIVSTNTEPLREGNCFSIEPGIYLPNKFGVRLETIVAARDGRLDSLNEAISDDLLELNL